MTTFTVAALQVGYDDAESPADRVARVADLVRAAVSHPESVDGSPGAVPPVPRPDLVVLPELWMPGGFHYEGWERWAEPIDGAFVAAMGDLARECGVVLHAGSFVERLPDAGPEGKWLANTSVLFGADGELLATYRKIHRFGFAAGEPALMEAGRGWVVVPVSLGHGQGAGVVKVGLATCYDLRFPELFRLLGEAGAEVVLVPAAWPLPRVAHWDLLGRARAIENQVVLVQVNTAGAHGGAVMGGHSQVVAATGEVLGVRADNREGALVVTVDTGDTDAYREAFPVLADRRL